MTGKGGILGSSRAHPVCRTVAALALVAAAAAGPGGGARAAETQNVFEVKGVAVDVTAATAAAARDRALADGHRKAFRRLLERLTLKADRDRLPDPSPEAIAPYVVDFSVAQEKSSTTRYLAALDFRFKRAEVRRLLTDRGLPFTETPSKPVLVLPVYEEAGALSLWDSPNPWRAAWDALPKTDGLVPLVLPLGDLTDIATIGAEQAARGDAQRLAAVAGRHGTADALVAHATKAVDPKDGSLRLDVATARYGLAVSGQTLVRTIPAAPEETLDALLKRAAREIAVGIEDDWKRDNLLQFASPAVLAVIVPIGGLPDWLAVRDRLAAVAVVRDADLVLLSRTEARVNLRYVGTPDQLVLALAQADLELKHEQAGWVVHHRPASSKPKGQ